MGVHRHGAAGLAKRASYPHPIADHSAPSRPQPRYAPTTSSGIRAVRFGLSEIKQRGQSTISLHMHDQWL
jgi:hypothetical protein